MPDKTPIYNGINLGGSSIANGGFESLSANPTALSVGQMYWNSVDGRIYGWTGSAWTNDAKTLEGYNSQKFLPFNISGYSAPFPLGVLIETDISAPSVFYLKISGLNYVSPYLPIDITLQGYMSNTTTLLGVKAYTNGSSITNFSAFIYNGKLAFWGIITDTNKTLFVECYHHDTNYNRIISVKNSAKPTTNIAADTTVTYITAWSSNNLTPSNFSNASDSFNFDATIEPTQTGTSSRTHLWSIQYALQGLKWIYTNWKSLFSDTSGYRIQLSKMQNRGIRINGNNIIGVNTDTEINLIAGNNITISVGSIVGGIVPITIDAGTQIISSISSLPTTLVANTCYKITTALTANLDLSTAARYINSPLEIEIQFTVGASNIYLLLATYKSINCYTNSILYANGVYLITIKNGIVSLSTLN